MKARVERTSHEELAGLISSVRGLNLEGRDQEMFNACTQSSTWLWAGFVDNECVCVVGLIPPTLLSDQAYLWLHTTPALKAHKFLFVRHSQRFIEAALELFPSIIGVTKPDNVKTIRWLKWLGATFNGRGEAYLSFEIRKA